MQLRCGKTTSTDPGRPQTLSLRAKESATVPSGQATDPRVDFEVFTKKTQAFIDQDIIDIIISYITCYIRILCITSIFYFTKSKDLHRDRGKKPFSAHMWLREGLKPSVSGHNASSLGQSKCGLLVCTSYLIGPGPATFSEWWATGRSDSSMRFIWTPGIIFVLIQLRNIQHAGVEEIARNAFLCIVKDSVSSSIPCRSCLRNYMGLWLDIMSEQKPTGLPSL